MKPPATPREPADEQLHGVTITDPYRWLESDDERVAEWTDAQNGHTASVLDGDVRDRLAERFAELAERPDYDVPTPAGDRYLQRVREADAEQPSLVVREEPDGEARVLANPDDWSDEGTVSIDWFVPDPDGTYVAFGVAPGGTEQYDIRVLEIATGETVDGVPDVGRGGARGFAWTDDGFFYTRTGDAGVGGDGEPERTETGTDGEDTDDADSQLDKEIRFHELGADPGADRLVTDDVGKRVYPVLDAADDTLVVVFSSGWDRSDVYALEADPTDHGADLSLHPVLTGYDAVFAATVHDGVCYFRTDHGATHSRVLAAPLDALGRGASSARGVSSDRDGNDAGEDDVDGDAAPDALDPDELVEVVPETDAVLREIVAADGWLVAHSHREAHSIVETFAIADGADGGCVGDGDAGADGADDGDADERGGTDRAASDGGAGEGVAIDHDTEEGGRGDVPDVEPHGEIDLDPFSSVGAIEAADGVAYFTEQSFDRPATVQAAELTTGDTRVLQAPESGFDVDVGVSQEWFTSADGTDMPAFVVRRTGVEPDGTAPAVLTGYGGFRVNRTPTFDRFLEPFLDAGGVFVLATLRGGTEFGEEWHEAGRREHKQHTFDDFLAVAEGLIDRGWAAEDRLGITGGSNGGLLVGAALTQRPDLFAAVLCRVPLLDMLRFHRFLLGETWTTEYGSPEDPLAFEYLREYSPYHNVEETEYPATLLTTASGDTRVHPSHARKMAARLQRRTTGGDPILLRVRDDAGHGVGKPRSMVVEEQAEQWAFLFRFLDVDVDVDVAGDGL